ncbi:MAG: hypothetical protein LBV62_01695 [Rickettsiales bacterium]|jgi:enamine deaminase RidA (YjgF/YER057c/UK114 family)|nr:hypothetical protein [Rickettsiales bacterium]
MSSTVTSFRAGDLSGQPNLRGESFATSEKQKGSVATLEEQEEFFDALEEQDWLISNIAQESTDISEGQEEFFDYRAAGFNIPLSIFHYKDYNSDFFTSWYNVSSRIFKEINQAYPEKQVLNLALSVLMFPYIVFTALGLVIYNKFKTNNKIQISSEENKTKKVSESTTKRLAYGVLAAVAILVSIPILLLLLIPATPALATFYLLNRKLSHSLIAVLQVSSGSYKNEHQNIEVSFHEMDAGGSDIKWDIEIRFPPQFEQLLKDLYKNKDDSWVDVRQDSERNTILRLSANIHLKNGLKPLRSEIRNLLATSIQEFAKTMEELMKLEKKDITYDKLRELLNEFRLKVVDSIGPKLASHLIQNAYQVAFIQAIKIAQKKDFLLEDKLKNILVEQELKSQGKELPSEKEVIIEDLKNAKIEVTKDLKDDEFSVYKAEWEQLIKEGKIAKRTIIDIYKSKHPKATEKALGNAKEEIERLRGIGQTRYNNIYKGLKEIHKNSSLTDGTLKRRLEDLFKFEYDDQEVERRLIKSVMKKAQGEWNFLFDKDKEQSLMTRLKDLEKNEKTSDEVNGFIKEAYLEIKKCKVQRLLKEQKKGILRLCEKLRKYGESSLAEIIEAFHVQDEGHLEESALAQILKDQNERLQAKQNGREKGHPITKSIEVLLERNEAILETLERLESEKKELLINEETKNNYREELTSREKIKFAIIEDELLNVLKCETFDEAEIKKLLEKVELEYCLAEKGMKGPVIEIKDNIKHFCQDLLSPLIDRLVKNIINNVPKSDQSPLLQPMKSFWTAFGCIRTGWNAAICGNTTTEGKALDVAHDTYKEVEAFLQHFESSYEEVGALVGDVFSDEGETFKNLVWPQIKNHLCGMWDRFFKDVEFKVGSRLDEVGVERPPARQLTPN